MQPLAALAPGAWRDVGGVFTDIDDTLTTEGAITPDALAALQALRAAPQDVHLLVTDYNMPGYSGVELLQAVREVRPDLPVALASGYVTAEIEQAALAAGARALIHKPNDVQELCDTVDRLIHAAE